MSDQYATQAELKALLAITEFLNTWKEYSPEADLGGSAVITDSNGDTLGRVGWNGSVGAYVWYVDVNYREES